MLSLPLSIIVSVLLVVALLVFLISKNLPYIGRMNKKTIITNNEAEEVIAKNQKK